MANYLLFLLVLASAHQAIGKNCFSVNMRPYPHLFIRRKRIFVTNFFLVSNQQRHATRKKQGIASGMIGYLESVLLHVEKVKELIPGPKK